MVSDTLYDAQFDRINGLLHYPWIGRDYHNNIVKLLILGDSHYATNEDGTSCEEEYNRCKSNKDYTREIVNCTVGKEDIWSMFKGLYSLFGVTPDTAEDCLWNKVAFCNFVQEPMETRNSRPSDEQFKLAWFCLLDIIDIIKPDICLFIGKRGWVSNGYINNERRGTIILKDDTVIISRCKPWRAEITTNNGVHTRAIAIHHTSQGFSPDKWRDYLNRKDKDIFTSIRN